MYWEMDKHMVSFCLHGISWQEKHRMSLMTWQLWVYILPLWNNPVTLHMFSVVLQYLTIIQVKYHSELKVTGSLISFYSVVTVTDLTNDASDCVGSVARWQRAGTWPVICRRRQQVPHLSIFQSLNPLNIQSSQKRTAGSAKSRDRHPGASRQQQHTQPCRDSRNIQSLIFRPSTIHRFIVLICICYK